MSLITPHCGVIRDSPLFQWFISENPIFPSKPGPRVTDKAIALVFTLFEGLGADPGPFLGNNDNF